MSDQDTEQEEEPSIEEILTSIRQIISDDDEEGEGVAEEAPAEEAAGDESEQESEPAEEAIELTEKIDDEPVAEEAAPEPEPEADEPMEEVSEPEPEPTPESEEEAPEEEAIEIEMQDPTPMPDPVDDEAILTNDAEDAAFEAFSELAKKTAVEHNGITVEEIVRSELRPLLKDWLDKNLPSIIERLVQEELERVAKRAAEE